MTEQASKPGGGFDKDGKPRPVSDQQAVKNQASVTPEDYPDKDVAAPDGKAKR